ncbi:DUF433 domain-containing protein [Methylohalobius crimeensis]|uniref:DUF433 domain-containing protein n=1 Tax=Methylohalobius crimeensis TaxID=244365 RepID=UPI00190F9B52|nr:DUF433 domain-containing protein [Methylohalobius crimeensis]
MKEDELLKRITVNPEIFGGKPIIRGRQLAVEHILGMLAAGDDFETLPGGVSRVGTRKHTGLPGMCPSYGGA